MVEGFLEAVVVGAFFVTALAADAFLAVVGLVEVRLALGAVGFGLAAERADGAFLVGNGLVGATFTFVATVLEAMGFLDTGLAF